MDEDLALELARIQRLAEAAVSLRMAAEQVGEAFQVWERIQREAPEQRHA
jgi:hypothetical protein